MAQERFGSSERELELIVPGDRNWNEPPPRFESRILPPGEKRDPDGVYHGFYAGRTESAQFSSGRKDSHVFRRASRGAMSAVTWSEKPVTAEATEELFLQDGRLFLWCRYHGLRWSAKNPKRKEKRSGTYELLRAAKVPEFRPGPTILSPVHADAPNPPIAVIG